MGSLAPCSAGTHHTISSPDGNIIVEEWPGDSGTPHYKINREDRLVLKRSRLGLVSDNFDLLTSLELTRVSEMRNVSFAS